MTISDLTQDQARALDLMLSGKNVFLTGEAGTGKSEVVKMFIQISKDNGKELIITAPTGTAADNLHGETIHRAFDADIGTQKNTRKLTERKDILRVADTVIIDEISMCRFDLFEYVARRIQFENECRETDRRNAEIAKLTGYKSEDQDKYDVKEYDLQLIVLGDFYQLPPVLTNDDNTELSKVYTFDYGKGYAFKSSLWDTMCFHGVVLKEIIRQDDRAFKEILTKIRHGEKKDIDICIDFLMRNSSAIPMTGDNAIYLVPTNKKCKEINDREMSKLCTESKTYYAEVSGDINSGDKFAEYEIELKMGCKVMLTVNDSSGRYVNGTMGIVKSLGDQYIGVLTEDGHLLTIRKEIKDITKPVVHTEEVEKVKTVNVPVLDKEGNQKFDENGNAIMEKAKKKVTETKETIVHEKVGSFIQFPIRIAYAITVHKSQGKTFEEINLDPYAWDDGQFYTAISRGKRIENICFLQYIQPKFIKTSKDVRSFMKKIEKASEGTLDFGE